MTVVRRLAPPDRRTPIDVAVGACRLLASCYCCPEYSPRKKGDKCRTPHPPVARKCSPPCPENIPPCAERTQMPQEAPDAPEGFRKPHMQCCVECGRVTARAWTNPRGQELSWCAGLFPKPTAKR